MLTSRPFSTISYNSQEQLLSVLEHLLKRRIINEWYFIHHDGEIDFYTNEREKDHFHVYISPSSRIDTEVLRDEFIEFDPLNPDKPLGVMPFQSSKLDDWMMYAVHDSTYLNQKGEVKEFSYSWKSIIAWDEEALKRAVKHASASAYRELFKRDYVMKNGVLRSYTEGFIKTNEVVGMSLIEKMSKELSKRY